MGDCSPPSRRVRPAPVEMAVRSVKGQHARVALKLDSQNGEGNSPEFRGMSNYEEFGIAGNSELRGIRNCGEFGIAGNSELRGIRNCGEFGIAGNSELRGIRNCGEFRIAGNAGEQR